MSNVHVFLEEDQDGDLVDIHYYCCFCGSAEGVDEWPAPESLDYPVYCTECGDRLPVLLSEYGQKELEERYPKYAWPGGYTVVYYDDEGEVYCADCARQTNANTKVTPVVYDEGPSMFCTECNAELESSYGDPDEQD